VLGYSNFGISEFWLIPPWLTPFEPVEMSKVNDASLLEYCKPSIWWYRILIGRNKEAVPAYSL
jgi:hypothetical protein